MKKKIIIIIGTRPEAIKLVPVYLALKKNSSCEVTIISTGQHKEMLQQIFSFFDIEPEVRLELMTANQSLSSITASLFISLDKEIQNADPDLIIVQGDTTSAMVAGMVGFYQKIIIAHVEAGLRSFDKYSPFPEEVNRKIISQVAFLNFAPTQQSFHNLKQEGAHNILVVGNTVIDSLLLAKNKIHKNRNHYVQKFESTIRDERKFVLITVHRRESFGNGLANICDALKTLANRFNELDFIFPVHLNPNVSKTVYDILDSMPNIFLLKPLAYDDMIYIMNECYMIMTDSGGIQEEAPSLHKPLIVLRDLTERPEGIEAGCAVLAGTTVDGIVEAFTRIYQHTDLYNTMSNTANPYGDGHASEKIATSIEKALFE